MCFRTPLDEEEGTQESHSDRNKMHKTRLLSAKKVYKVLSKKGRSRHKREVDDGAAGWTDSPAVCPTVDIYCSPHSP